MNILITICARAGSKGLPGKHTKYMNDKPLIEWTMNHALDFINFFGRILTHKIRVVVCSDDKRAIELARTKEIPFMTRPKELCGDDIGKLDVISHIFKAQKNMFGFDADYIIDLDATNPLRRVRFIADAFHLAHDRNCTVLSATPARKNPFFNQVFKPDDEYRLVKSGLPVLARQNAPVVYDLNASIGVFPYWQLEKGKETATEPGFVIYEMPYWAAFDIDNAVDFDIVELLQEKYLL